MPSREAELMARGSVRNARIERSASIMKPHVGEELDYRRCVPATGSEQPQLF
jgi:hypothetical protein